jgi:multidrug efflux pump subunit AcrA (membrane-fusion protein)
MSLGKRIVRWLMTLSVLVGGGVAFLAWQGLLPIAKGKSPEKAAASAETKSAEKPRKIDPIAVTVAQVTGRPVQRKVHVVGTLFGTEEVEIAAKVDGRVLQILHDVGDVVHPGEVLLEVDQTDLQLVVNEANRALDLELTRIGLASTPDRDFDVGTLPSVARARLLEKNARNKFERTQSLYKRQSISREDLEQTETDFEVAQANTRQAQLDAESIVAAIRQREALLETARQRLRDAKVLVPTPSMAQMNGNQVVQVSAGGRRKAAPDVEYVVAARTPLPRSSSGSSWTAR